MTEQEPVRVLLIEDNPGDARLIREHLAEAERGPFEVDHAESLSSGLERLEADAYDVVLLDLSLPESRGLETFRRANAAATPVPVVVLTGFDDEEQAERTLQEGAQDYLVRGRVDGNGLGRALRYAIERGRIEEELRRRAEALAEADRRKDAFLAMLAHELRAPLAPLLSAAEVLRTEEVNEAERAWAREAVDRQVRHMARLLDDLLDVSRISRGKIKIRTRRLRLSDVVAGALDTIDPLLAERRHEVSVSLPEETVWLDADPTRLEQILVNLLHNAVVYTDPAGRIGLEAVRHTDEAVVRVRDTGVGMDRETLERIFEPFTQAERTLDRAEGGLGIGLSLARALVELHGGSLAASSPGPGQGSEFVVRLPVASAPEAEEAAAPIPEQEAASLAVLVVDDHPDTAAALSHLVRLWGHETWVAHDGEEALEMARAVGPDVVLLDLGLPRRSGYEVASALRADPATAGTTLVAVSGYGQEEDKRRAREAGFDRHLTKPAEPEALRRLLSAVRPDRRGSEVRANR